MKYTDLKLDTARELVVHGAHVGTIERIDYGDRINGLRITCGDRPQVALPNAVDVSEQLDAPRIFVIEGAGATEMFLFGGEYAFRLSTDLTQVTRVDLFRSSGAEEYWTTSILEQPAALIIIYEAGVLVIDEDLRVRMHQPKLFNDFFVAIEETAIRFARDHEREWLMPLDHA